MLIDVPARIAHRAPDPALPAAGDGAAVNAADLASLDELRPWMPWAQGQAELDESEVDCRRMQAKFHAARGSGDADLRARCQRQRRPTSSAAPACTASTGTCAASRSATGAQRRARPRRHHRSDPRAGANGLRHARRAARRDPHRRQQRASWKVAERAGFTLEALLRGDSLTPRASRAARAFMHVCAASRSRSVRRRPARQAEASPMAHEDEAKARQRRSTLRVPPRTPKAELAALGPDPDAAALAAFDDVASSGYQASRMEDERHLAEFHATIQIRCGRSNSRPRPPRSAALRWSSSF